MTLDDRLRSAGTLIALAARDSQADVDDLNHRHRRRRRLGAMAATASLLLVVGVVTAVIASAFDDDGESVIAGEGGASQQPAERAVQPAQGPAYSLTDHGDWRAFRPEMVRTDQGEAFAGEEFTHVAVRFATEQPAISSPAGSLTGSIRVGVGTYNDQLRAVFPDSGIPLDLGGRAFEIVEVNRATFTQIAIVPLDLSERTFLITGRGVDADALITVAETIDPTARVPRIGSEPDGFIVVHSGTPEYPVLADGIAVSYRGPTGDRTLTITTYRGASISCFAHAWVFPDTEIASIGGDAGVIAQLSGTPDGVGTYQALWNVDHDTLIGLTASGIDRSELIGLADQLVVDPAPTTAYLSDLPFAF